MCSGKNGPWRSLVTRYTGGVEIAGSNPVGPICKNILPITYWNRPLDVRERGYFLKVILDQLSKTAIRGDCLVRIPKPRWIAQLHDVHAPGAIQNRARTKTRFTLIRLTAVAARPSRGRPS